MFSLENFPLENFLSKISSLESFSTEYKIYFPYLYAECISKLETYLQIASAFKKCIKRRSRLVLCQHTEYDAHTNQLMLYGQLRVLILVEK